MQQSGGDSAITGPPLGVAAAKQAQLTSKFTGVCWNKKNKRWQASINSGGKYLYLGSFTSEVEAAKVFDQAAIQLRGRDTKLNFPLEDYLDENGQASLGHPCRQAALGPTVSWVLITCAHMQPLSPVVGSRSGLESATCDQTGASSCSVQCFVPASTTAAAHPTTATSVSHTCPSPRRFLMLSCPCWGDFDAFLSCS
jgi:hypothetical protein